VPRLQYRRYAVLLAAVLVAMTVPPELWAQTSLPSVLRPVLDGDPADPPRFRKPNASRRTQTPSFGAPPGSGAGKTGFNSTNARRRKATAAKPKAAAAAKLLPVTPASRVPQPRAVTRAQITPGIAPPPRRRPIPEPDPFAPVGLRSGPLIWFPAIEFIGGYDTNPGRTRTGSGSSLFTVAPELLLRSDWSRHELRGDLRGSYTTYPSESSLDRPFVDARLAGRVDVSRQTRLDLESRFLLSTDNPGSPDLRADLAKLPIYTTLGASAGAAHRFNRFEIAAKGDIDRTTYQDSKLTDGSTASNEDRNYNQYGGQLRGSYELLPGVKPFAEIGADARVHDLTVNGGGFRRDSRGVTVRGGSTFELTPLLTGEASLGYLVRSYDDPRLPDLDGLLVDASLIWSASALTSVKLFAKTSVDETTLPGVSGTFRRDFGVQVDHAFRRWLIGTAKLGYGLDDYVGSPRSDERYLASAALAYKLTRTVQIKGEFRQEWLRSSDSNADYTASIFLVGLRLQR
jgi:hypothetical protein